MRHCSDIEIVLAKKFIANLSEEVKKGQKEKLAQGWLPTKPPIGYKTTGDKGHKIHVIDNEKAPFMKDMFELYSYRQLLYHFLWAKSCSKKALEIIMAVK